MADTGINSLRVDLSQKAKDKIKTDENNNKYIETDIWDANNKDNLDCASKIVNNCYETDFYSAKGEAIWNKMAELNDLDSDYDKAMIMPEQKIILPKSIDVREIVTTDLEDDITQNDIYGLDGNLLETIYTNKYGYEVVQVFDSWVENYRVASEEPFRASGIIDNCPAIITKENGKTYIDIQTETEFSGSDEDDSKVAAQKVEVYDSEGNLIQIINKNYKGEELSVINLE